MDGAHFADYADLFVNLDVIRNAHSGSDYGFGGLEIQTVHLQLVGSQFGDWGDFVSGLGRSSLLQC